MMTEEMSVAIDDELDRVRDLRVTWDRTWQEHLPLRKLLHRLEDPDVAAALVPSPEPDAVPVRVQVDLPTKPTGLRDPLLELQTIEWAAQMIDRAKADVVAECRRRGRSWANIGEALGVARQSAWMKYGPDEED